MATIRQPLTRQPSPLFALPDVGAPLVQSVAGAGAAVVAVVVGAAAFCPPPEQPARSMAASCDPMRTTPHGDGSPTSARSASRSSNPLNPTASSGGRRVRHRLGDLRPGHRNCAHRRHLGRGGHGFAGGNAGRLTSGETASDARLPTDHARLHPGLPRSSSRSPSKTGRQRRRRAVPLHRGGVSAAGRRTGRAVDRDLGGVGRPAPGRTGDVDGATKGLDAVAEPNES